MLAQPSGCFSLLPTEMNVPDKNRSVNQVIVPIDTVSSLVTSAMTCISIVNFSIFPADLYAFLEEDMLASMLRCSRIPITWQKMSVPRAGEKGSQGIYMSLPKSFGRPLFGAKTSPLIFAPSTSGQYLTSFRQNPGMCLSSARIPSPSQREMNAHVRTRYSNVRHSCYWLQAQVKPR